MTAIKSSNGKGSEGIRITPIPRGILRWLGCSKGGEKLAITMCKGSAIIRKV